MELEELELLVKLNLSLIILDSQDLSTFSILIYILEILYYYITLLLLIYISNSNFNY